MRWPWTSVRRLDDLRSERDWLRTQVADLTDQLTRLRRREEGLPEEPLKPRVRTEPMPADVRQYLDGLYPENMRKAIRDQVLRAASRGDSWETIRGQIMPAPFKTGGEEDAYDEDDYAPEE